MPRERDEPNLDKLLTVPCYVYICIRGSRPGRIEQLRRTEEPDTASQPGAIKHPHTQCEKTPPGHSLGRIVVGWRHVAALAVPTRLPSMPFLLTMPPRG